MEDELVRFFLRLKVMRLPLPSPNYILELDLYGENEPYEIWDTFMGPCPARIDVVARFTEFTQKIRSANLDILDDPVLQSHHVDDDPLLAPAESSAISTIVYNDDSEYNLRAILGSVAYPQTQDQKESNQKRLKTSSGSSNSLPPPTLLPSSQPIGTVAESTGPLILVDSQETGVQLVHTLLACTEAVEQDNLKLADAPVKQFHGRGGKTRRGLWNCEG
ncbi:hypothetical protein FH972_002649 [Carpinus fangiana]|uniref:Uncharacterized protein n=1 Tax=Carpinus fangiana TaxID=176857 RepID=A0A5N6QHW8_9ROSI|nr:hypothetical protein FH972_002649 [Carpinus fangiana]